MFEKYQLDVLKYYRELKNLVDCPTVLRKPTPASLRDFCFNFKVSNCTNRDAQVLKEFFGGFSSKEDLANLIKGIDVDRFKPVISFMNEKTSNPSIITVELLAWLIDFGERPFRFDTFNTPIELESQANNQTAEEWKSSPNEGISLLTRLKLKIRLILVSIALIFGIYFLVDKSYYEGITPAVLLSENFAKNQCMYWNDTSYVSIACDEQLPNKLLVAADFDKISNFKRITKPDTLSEADIGKVWYSKIKNKVEFFSGPGVHPQHNDKHLKPLTLYMLRKYTNTGGM